MSLDSFPQTGGFTPGHTLAPGTVMREYRIDRVLGVTKTPEYFVNGRPLPRFGLEELQGLVAEELRNSYP